MEILVERDAHDYVSACVDAANGEVGGLAYVELNQPGLLYIYEFVLLEQEASAASVDFDGEAYLGEITKAAESGRENHLRCSWHSHGSMDVYWSSTDENGIQEYSKLGMPWLLSLVYNKNKKIKARVDIFNHELNNQITLDNCEYFVEANTQIIEKAKEDVKRMVKKPKNTVAIKKSNGFKKSEEYAESFLDGNDYYSAYLYNDHDDEDRDMPYWIEVSDFLDSTSRAIMEMQYGTKNVERWEDEIFNETTYDENGFLVVDSSVEEEVAEKEVK